KTTAALRYADLLAAQGWAVDGLAAPARRDDRGDKVGIEALDLSTGERRLLATVVAPDAPAVHGAAVSGAATIGRYHFHPDAMAWMRAVALDALAHALDLVVIDEIGPLERDQGAGLADALHRLDSTCAGTVLILARAAMQAWLAERLAHLSPEVVVLTPANRETIPGALALRLLGR
ncbi:MAG: nucleoside-triphosphatase, partial [Chloroflexota bacterium]